MTTPKTNPTYQEFKKWIDEREALASVMQEVKDPDVLDDLLESNTLAWYDIKTMLEDFTLHYQPNGKPKHKKRKNKVGKRPDMVSVLVNLFKIDKLLGTFESLQEDIKPKYREVYGNAWIELEELTGSLISHCMNVITPRESRQIDKIQEKEAESEGDNG